MNMWQVKNLYWVSAIAMLVFGCENANNDKIPIDTDKIVLMTSKGIKNNYKNFDKIGYKKGDKILDFTLFSLDGIRFNFSEILKINKPILLISGSYTCDITRRNMVDINSIAAKYKNFVDVYFIYTIDAHPSDTAGPYSKDNRLQLTSENIKEHIDAKQPKTYGERKLLARLLQQKSYVIPPILIDNPANSFWLSFGQSPNTAYLIKPNGTVYFRQTWFRFRDLDEIIRAIIRQ
ncbi:deiodinase-like protein [Spirosoma endbachense]|uniref:Thioredoxin domain-containing protein n=1 Tax=Spirosoma endbachense TaxID=2666025 RepID=A0A6P1VZX5_9BACT|nr:deiodinase-like protein [Spirosoma endbachense]QHV97337.1 hypothetical protein GJR95_21030 [Spirosoma endbachense]